MRKIISILITLGVILGLTLAAAPVAAQVDCPADCTPIDIDDLAGPPDFCAGMVSDYLLGDPGFVTSITLPVSLIAGADSLSVDFPSDTDLSDVDPADVIVNSLGFGGPFSPAAITVTDQHLSFLVPIGFFPGLPAGDIITIEVDDVINPTVADDYCLFVDYMLDCCTPIQFDCVEYTVNPAYKEYAFHFDFGKTFLGIAEDFIPPFKACGQDGFGYFNATTGAWLDIFDVILTDENGGCLPKCGNASMWFVLTACPAGETVTFVWDQLGDDDWYTLGAADVGTEFALPDVDLTLGPPPDVVWECKLHFSSPGDYEICFYLECPAVPCTSGAQIVAEKCLPAKVHQWKDPGKMILDEKWNLVSLPIVPFDTSIANLLLSLPAEAKDKDGVDDLISIHNYDRTGCADPGTWKVYAQDGSQTSLQTMEDGKSYWVRMTYPEAGNMPYTWWVFGTALPMPPASPKQYPACTGWNMMGFTSLVDDAVTDYLWNFATGSYVVYGWDNTGSWLTSGWEYIDPGVPDDLETGQGYWTAFAPPGGYIYVPGP